MLLWVRFYCELATVLMIVQTGRREDEESIEVIVKLVATNIIMYT